MMGVGIFSAMVLRSLVSKANSSTTNVSLISYQADADEFPLPVPASIYRDESEHDTFSTINRIRTRCMDRQFVPKNDRSSLFVTSMRGIPPKEPCSEVVEMMRNEEVENPSAAPIVVPEFLTKEESLADADALGPEVLSSCDQFSEYQLKSAEMLKSTNYEEPLYDRVNKIPSDPAAGDTYLILEPPEDTCESAKPISHSQTEANTLSSFTGPFLVLNDDDSTSQSVTWTEAFVEREPFDHAQEGKSDKKSRKTKSNNQKC